jgi:hypothetical protein
MRAACICEVIVLYVVYKDVAKLNMHGGYHIHRNTIQYKYENID